MLKDVKNLPYLGQVQNFLLVPEIPVKIYFADIKGREPSLYEWDKSEVNQETVILGVVDFLNSSLRKDVPHITVAFPHITTIYRFGDPRLENERETNLYRVGDAASGLIPKVSFTNTESELVSRIMGCPLEMNPILSQEMLFWSMAPNILEYLNANVPVGEVSYVTNENKLRDHLIKLDF